MNERARADEKPALAERWLTVNNLSFTYRNGSTPSEERRHAHDWVLHGLSLTVNKGEFACILGPSGCGKSTLMQLVAGFLTPTHGRIAMDGKLIKGPGTDRALVPQQTTLYPWLNVLQNVALPLQVQGIGRADRIRRAQAALETVGLSAVADERPERLSGGMQQRVMVARALVQNARLLLMDEPFGALDALTRERMQQETLRIWQHTGVTVFLITHDVEEAALLATRVFIMGAEPGRIVDAVELEFGKHIAGGHVSSHKVRSSRRFIAARELLRARMTA